MCLLCVRHTLALAQHIDHSIEAAFEMLKRVGGVCGVRCVVFCVCVRANVRDGYVRVCVCVRGVSVCTCHVFFLLAKHT